MYKFSAQLKSHTHWWLITEGISDEEFLENILLKTHKFSCTDFFDLEIDNLGKITFTFNRKMKEDEVRNISAIFLYFVSLCCGFNCEYKEDAYIDDIKHDNFFNFAKEDKLPIIKGDKYPPVLYKDLKVHEIGLNDIHNTFNYILDKLFNMKLNLTLLSNFYAMVFYKDFIGNGEYLFRIIVTNIESLITLMNKNDYDNILEEHSKFLHSLKEIIKSKENKEDFKKYGINCTNLGGHLQQSFISLQKKLKDTFLYLKKYGLEFKLNLETETTKIADTRNFISHNFDKDKVYLTQEERSDYTEMLREIFRMLFLEYCGVDVGLIKQSFFNTSPSSKVIRNILEKFFEIEN